MCQRLGQHSFCLGHLHKKKALCVCAVFETSSLWPNFDVHPLAPTSIAELKHCLWPWNAQPRISTGNTVNYGRPLSPENWHTGTVEFVCIFVRHGSYPVMQDPSHILLKTCITIICESHCTMHPCPGPPTHHHNLSGSFQGWEGRNVRNRLPPS